jgi:uncharacterized protein UPF0242
METRYLQTKTLLSAIIFLYWLPIVFLCLSVSIQIQWWLVVMTLCITSIGAISFLALLIQWEKHLTNTLTVAVEPSPSPILNKTENCPNLHNKLIEDLQNSFMDSKQQNEILKKDLDGKAQQTLSLQNELQVMKDDTCLLHQQLDQLKISSAEHQSLYKKALLEKETCSKSHQQLLNEKQQRIEILENKISDLNYEIKTLLKINI